jgi:hypothetical protein
MDNHDIFLYSEGGRLVFGCDSCACGHSSVPLPNRWVVSMHRPDFVMELLSHEAGTLEFEVTNKHTEEARRLWCADNFRSVTQLWWELWPAEGYDDLESEGDD